MNSSRTPIEAGSRFQSIREGAFGNRRISYWRVESVSRRSEGLDHGLDVHSIRLGLDRSGTAVGPQ